jgi:cation transport ATPase
MRRNKSATSPKDGKQRQEEQSKLKKRTEVTDYDTDGNKMQSSETDEPEKEKPKEPMSLKKVLTRSATASVMALLYLSIIYAGHFYCMLAVILTQVCFLIMLRLQHFSIFPIFRRKSTAKLSTFVTWKLVNELCRGFVHYNGVGS